MKVIQINKPILNALVTIPFVLCAFITSTVQAKSTAITHATVYTLAGEGTIENATVIIDQGKITQVYSSDNTPENINTDEIIDAKGRILTPGFIGSMNSLGLVEVSAVARSRDSKDKEADITFDASLAFNPKSTLIAYTRKGGITSNIVAPQGGEDLFAGQSFVVDLSGEFNSVTDRQNAVIVHLGAETKGSRALKLQALDYKFEDAQKALAKQALANKSKDKKAKEDKEPKRDELVINALLAGEKPLIAYADRATDLLALIALKQKYGLDLVLVGASDAVLIVDEIVAANVPIILSAIDNLPSSFDSLHANLSNMAMLTKAGVKVILAPEGDSHNINRLRFDAGVAVANGVSRIDALAALTANVADVFKLNSGRIQVGKNADLVLWSADPFELSTKVDSMWINGKSISTRSRQDDLRDRYLTKSDMPKAYSK
ncbi:amidohydrolase family protein [Paraglaciecola arctica]|uniref:amidohydrolase family protein n=1 Tax=Paraglaciecola arctica TaxID=1128911 RepID=UPI001C073E33|nr:amidohydrolase family protein [Paraglaciecola arctica]MBU3006162.1 amidohydrolase family protein [Paraglaciecola arctica]